MRETEPKLNPQKGDEMKKIRDEQKFKRNPQAVIFTCKPPKKRCEMLGRKIKLTIMTPIKSSHRSKSYYADE